MHSSFIAGPSRVLSQDSTALGAWADLKITFIYDASEAPLRKRFVPLDDPTCMPENLMPLSEAMIVDRETKGIKNMVMYLDPKKSEGIARNVYPALQMPPLAPAVLDIRGCGFEPHIFSSRVGQTIRLTNSDDYGHNPNFVFFANGLESRMHPPGHSINIDLKLSEKAPTPIHCSIHPWMRAYVLVFDHPYSGISDEKGVLKIEKLPARKPITFKIWHESMERSIAQVQMEFKPKQWPKGIVEWTLEPGLNDFGIVKIKPDQFKP